MPVPIYSLRRIYNQQIPGSTRPARCSVDAVLKFDDPESAHCVYNEYVSLRLAQTCCIPVADGGLVLCGAGHAFASLRLGVPGLTLPDVNPLRRDRTARRYPEEAAALVAFDLWVGNWDRGNAVKATHANPHLDFFCAYDHSHALLNVEEDPLRSIWRLESDDLIVRFHPFYGRVEQERLERWLMRIGAVPDETITAACCFGQPFRGVPVEQQESLARALSRRKGNIWDAVGANEHIVYRIAGAERPFLI